MRLPLLFFPVLIALSDTLTLPDIYPIQGRNKTYSHLNIPALAFPISNPAPSPLTQWPPLPLIVPIPPNLALNITALGSPILRSNHAAILGALTDLIDRVATEGNLDETIGHVYARNYAIVYIVFRFGEGLGVRRQQIVLLLGKLWLLMAENGPRAVVGSEIVVEVGEEGEGKRIASFALNLLG
ncbi:hypothetical protein BDR22DRAFT_820014 [Usnea florida]